MSPIKHFSCVVLLAVVPSISACAPASHDTAKATATPVTPAASSTGALAASRPSEELGQHWVQSDQLRNLMKDISAKTQRNWPKNVPGDPEEDQVPGDIRHAFDDAARLADGLAAAAVRIPGSVMAGKMNEADRAGFSPEANILRDQAFRLGEAARSKKIEQMQKSLDALSATCVSCHSRYRDFSGQINIQRASTEQPGVIAVRRRADSSAR